MRLALAASILAQALPPMEAGQPPSSSQSPSSLRFSHKQLLDNILFEKVPSKQSPAAPIFQHESINGKNYLIQTSISQNRDRRQLSNSRSECTIIHKNGFHSSARTYQSELDLSEPDVGILECPPHQYCFQNSQSSRGGFCQDSFPAPLLKTAGDGDWGDKTIYGTITEKNSKYRRLQEFVTNVACEPENLDPNCDCTGFNYEIQEGTFFCTIYDSDFCFDKERTICGSFSVERTVEGYIDSSTYCYSFTTPYETEVCYTYNNTPGCAIAIDGNVCNRCEVVDGIEDPVYGFISYGCYDFDCSNTKAEIVGVDCLGMYVLNAVLQSGSNGQGSEIDTDSPSGEPSTSPTFAFSSVPSFPPSSKPSTIPSHNPSSTPSQSSSRPSSTPSSKPSPFSSPEPSMIHSSSPSSTRIKSISPTVGTTITADLAPSTLPSINPTPFPSDTPSTRPTIGREYTDRDLTLSPTEPLTTYPTITSTDKPSTAPTGAPTNRPSSLPTKLPTEKPTRTPSMSPTITSSEFPTRTATERPTNPHSVVPISLPTRTPIIPPTNDPTLTSDFSTTPTNKATTDLLTTLPTNNPSVTTLPTIIPLSGRPSAILYTVSTTAEPTSLVAQTRTPIPGDDVSAWPTMSSDLPTIQDSVEVGVDGLSPTSVASRAATIATTVAAAIVPILLIY